MTVLPRAARGAVGRLAGAPPLLLAAIAIFLLTAMDAVVKGQMIEHPVLFSVFLRFVAGSLVALVVVLIARPPMPTQPELKANLVRAPLVVLTAGSFFFAVDSLPLAEVMGLSFLAPGFIAVLGVVILKERLDGRIIGALAFGLAGMAVMLWPKLGAETASSAVFGVTAALVSAVAYAVNIILLRQLAVGQHPATIVAFQNVGPAVILLPVALWLWSAVSALDLLMFGLAGALGVAGHLLLTQAFAKAPASRVAPMEYTALVWAAVLGFAFFSELPTLWTLAGSALIVAGAFWLGRR
jgi:S-adenosylmethionine uptake transporter